MRRSFLLEKAASSSTRHRDITEFKNYMGPNDNNIPETFDGGLFHFRAISWK